MTTVKNATATFNGLPMNDVRPGSYVTYEDHQKVIEDQVHLYEAITGETCPNDNSGFSDATAHIHDATNGAPIRIPLLHTWINFTSFGFGDGPARAQDFTTTGGGVAEWLSFVHAPFFVPAGISAVDVLLFCSSAAEGNVRVTIENASLTETDGPTHGDFVPDGHFEQPNTNRDDMRVLRHRMSVTAGACNVLKVQAWDGFSSPAAATDTDGPGRPTYRVSSVVVLPVDGPPMPEVATWRAPTLAASPGDYRVHSAFQETDSALASVDASGNSAVYTWMAGNDALCWEVLTGRPAGYLVAGDRTFTGHDHKGDGGTALNSSGAEIDHALGAWYYGVVIQTSASDADRGDADANSGTNDVEAWRGRIWAVYNTTNTSTQNVARHRVRLPSATDANLGVTGSTTKLKLYALVYRGATAGTLTVGAQMFNDSGAAGGTLATATTTNTSTREILTISNVEASTDASDGEATQDLLITFGDSSAGRGNAALLGVCLAYEA